MDCVSAHKNELPFPLIGGVYGLSGGVQAGIGVMKLLALMSSAWLGLLSNDAKGACRGRRCHSWLNGDDEYVKYLNHL